MGSERASDGSFFLAGDLTDTSKRQYNINMDGARLRVTPGPYTSSKLEVDGGEGISNEVSTRHNDKRSCYGAS